jgi:diaminopimelate epimerase
MKISFSKYQGTGNDFVMLDNLNGQYDSLSIPQIKFLCDRKFGIGSDGLIKINSHNSTDFEIEYFNSDGSKSFCGNGARCSVSFAETLGINVSNTEFLGIDGLHKASKKQEVISLEMGDVLEVRKIENDFVIQTGSPHYIRFIDSINDVNIVHFGKEIRYSDEFKEEGINVNLVEVIDSNNLIVNTYERGVEDETLSCGTGVTACVVAFAFQTQLIGEHQISVKVKGGNLSVSFNQKTLGIFTNIHLIGPGEFVFSGEINV